MLKKLVAILIAVGAIFAFFYYFRNYEPLKTYTTPYVNQAVVFIQEQAVNVKNTLGEYLTGFLALGGTAVASIFGVAKKYVDRQKENIMAKASDEVTTVQSELTRVLGLNQGLQIENSELKVKLARLENVEENMNALQSQLNTKIREVEQLTAERNEAERMMKAVLNPPEPEVKVE